MVKISKQSKALALPMAIFTVICMAVLSFGVYIVFSDILLSVRSMYGLCVFFALVGIVVTTVVRVPMAKASVILFSWLMFVFTFTYGNALNQQKAYSNFRIEEAISGLKQVDALTSEDVVYVQITGSIGYCKPVEKLLNEYRVLEELVPTGFNEHNDTFGYTTLCNYYKLNLVYDETIDMKQMDLPVVSDTVYHTIKNKDKYILIELK